MSGDDSRVSDYVPYEDTMALTKWRQAISAATSSSQLAVCVNQLEMHCLGEEPHESGMYMYWACRQNSKESYYHGSKVQSITVQST